MAFYSIGGPPATLFSSVRPKRESLNFHDACEYDDAAVNHLNVEATRILWHQCLGHVPFRKLSELHTHVDGIPKIALPTYIGGCRR
jgi:hypothetical protein